MSKILIIRLSSFGDIVLTTPVIRCLKNQLKGAEIHYLVKKKFADVIRHNPYLSGIHQLENSISEVIPLLKKEKFDYVVDLHNNIRSFWIKQQLGRPAFTVNKINLRKWIMVNFKWNILPDVHIVDRYLETVKSLGIETDGEGLDYVVPAEEEIPLYSLPQAFQQGYIAFVIGGNYATKKLPPEKIISICLKINQPIILLGGKEDAEAGDFIASGYKTQSKSREVKNFIFNACGKYGINQSASIVKQSKKVIAHDTGLMHIAAAFKKEIISVWGNTIPEFGMYPYYGKSQVPNPKFQIPNLSCRPCSKLGFKKCPGKHFKCMMLQDEAAIAAAAMRISNPNI